MEEDGWVVNGVDMVFIPFWATLWETVYQYFGLAPKYDI